ncbi:hypothetical protein ACIQ9P_04220 [Kitasatospora sp. NPDC094019]|uniref:hypothetical protein n=1 Tax=Kitasatospora sp. NPDC094019 TaxID=3364091 RepID=UPI00382168D4
MTHNRPENPNPPDHVGLAENHRASTDRAPHEPGQLLRHGGIVGVHRVTASTITDPDLDQLWERTEDAEARLKTAADLLQAGHSPLLDRAGIVRRLCLGEITPEQARADDRGE